MILTIQKKGEKCAYSYLRETKDGYFKMETIIKRKYEKIVNVEREKNKKQRMTKYVFEIVGNFLFIIKSILIYPPIIISCDFLTNFLILFL